MRVNYKVVNPKYSYLYTKQVGAELSLYGIPGRFAYALHISGFLITVLKFKVIYLSTYDVFLNLQELSLFYLVSTSLSKLLNAACF